MLQKYLLREFTNFDLTLISQFDSESENGRGDRLCLRLMYNLNRYTQHSANQVLMRYAMPVVNFFSLDTRLKSMIINLAESMGQLLGNVPLTSEVESQEMISWNDTETPELLSETLIPDRFSDIAKKYPDSVALVIADEQITFRELDRRSEVLRTYLLSVGITPESMIAVSMDRSIELIVALVGT